MIFYLLLLLFFYSFALIQLSLVLYSPQASPFSPITLLHHLSYENDQTEVDEPQPSTSTASFHSENFIYILIKLLRIYSTISEVNEPLLDIIHSGA